MKMSNEGNEEKDVACHQESNGGAVQSIDANSNEKNVDNLSLVSEKNKVVEEKDSATNSKKEAYNSHSPERGNKSEEERDSSSIEPRINSTQSAPRGSELDDERDLSSTIGCKLKTNSMKLPAR